ncbi:GAF domain-containing hybrid sensor histidine kinase/response regulator [Rhizorhabdus argentea]|uniref:GAF domain-containing hybrid sensor histidine kinase/response regulator n=1 Tax=Rhizorhabdus argentea TaxID=1387174 RepID=UPI0030EE772F
MGRSDWQDDVNAQRLLAERWSLLAVAVEQLGAARSLDQVIEILRASSRRISGADGIAIVLRDGDQCHYVAEDAKAPLWAGQRFQADSCISGIAMRDRLTVVIPAVMTDPRVPHAAYEPTFVRSMVMVPVGLPDPVAAIGAYWSDVGAPNPGAVPLLEALSRAAATALENGRLVTALEELNRALETRIAERTAELERAQEIARQAQKMEVIGQLTGSIAHDFNNLLTPIMGSLDLVLGRKVLTEGVLRSANVAMEAAERAKRLVQHLLAFARRQPLAPSPVDLHALAGGMLDLLTSSLGSRIRLSLDIAPDLPRAHADRHQLEMALLNLAVNARDAMPGGGSLILSARHPTAEERPAILSTGDFVCLSVRDSGTGMDEATLAQAVEPFFSTKSADHGTGLGLSMVHGLAAQFGGALQLFSTPGAGTNILLWLPVAKSPAQAVIPTAKVDGGLPGMGTILVIDDEPIVRRGTAEMLSSLGYDVVQAASAREGLGLIEDGLDPSVVVTDHIMPGMTGAELALRLRADRPQTAVMIISGYQGVDLIAPDVVRLSKPFRQIHLTASIAAAREQVMA